MPGPARWDQDQPEDSRESTIDLPRLTNYPESPNPASPHESWLNAPPALTATTSWDETGSWPTRSHAIEPPPPAAAGQPAPRPLPGPEPGPDPEPGPAPVPAGDSPDPALTALAERIREFQALAGRPAAPVPGSEPPRARIEPSFSVSDPSAAAPDPSAAARDASGARRPASPRAGRADDGTVVSGAEPDVPDEPDVSQSHANSEAARQDYSVSDPRAAEPPPAADGEYAAPSDPAPVSRGRSGEPFSGQGYTSGQEHRAMDRRRGPADWAGMPADRPARGSLAELRLRLERLPAGHPSSPYDETGARRPAAEQLRQLELPLADEDEHPIRASLLTPAPDDRTAAGRLAGLGLSAASPAPLPSAATGEDSSLPRPEGLSGYRPAGNGLAGNGLAGNGLAGNEPSGNGQSRNEPGRPSYRPAAAYDGDDFGPAPSYGQDDSSAASYAQDDSGAAASYGLDDSSAAASYGQDDSGAAEPNAAEPDAAHAELAGASVHEDPAGVSGYDDSPNGSGRDRDEPGWPEAGRSGSSLPDEDQSGSGRNGTAASGTLGAPAGVGTSRLAASGLTPGVADPAPLPARNGFRDHDDPAAPGLVPPVPAARLEALPARRGPGRPERPEPDRVSAPGPVPRGVAGALMPPEAGGRDDPLSDDWHGGDTAAGRNGYARRRGLGELDRSRGPAWSWPAAGDSGEQRPRDQPPDPVPGRRHEGLTAAQEAVADQALSRYKAADGRNVFGGYGESGLTPAMRRVEANLPHGRLAPDTDQHSLKSPERFKDKLARMIARHPGIPAADLAADICDAARFAFVFEPQDYTDGTWLVHRRLKAQGFDLEARRNRWDTPEFKGIRTRWRDPAHDLAFEVQFHTPASWDVVQRTHAAYVRITDPRTSAAERSALRERQVAATAGTPLPARCAEIGDFRADVR